jgi:hypothetical protein
MGTTPLTGSRYPSSPNTDAFVPDQDLHNALLDIEDNVIPRFTTTAVRDSAYSAWMTATGNTLGDGMHCHVTSTGIRYRYDSVAGGWVIDGGRSQFNTLTINTGWSAVSGHTPRGYMTAAKVSFIGWFQNSGSFTVNGSQTPINIPAGLQSPATDQVLLLPYASPSSGEGLIVVTMVAASGALRMDYLVSGPTPIPVNSHFFLDSLGYHPTYAG